MTARFTVGPEAQARAVARHKAERESNRADLTARMTAAYLAEPDRDYAEDFYGEMLRERGVDTSALDGVG